MVIHGREGRWSFPAFFVRSRLPEPAPARARPVCTRRPCRTGAGRLEAPLADGRAPGRPLSPGWPGLSAGEYFLCDGFLTPGKNVLPIGKKTRLGESIMAVEYKDYYKLLGVERSAGADVLSISKKLLTCTDSTFSCSCN